MPGATHTDTSELDNTGARRADASELDKTPAIKGFRGEAAAVSAVRFGARHEDTPGEDRRLMTEVPATGEDHRRARLLDRGDHFVVAFGPARLDEG